MFEREGVITQPNIKNPSYFTFVNVSGQLVGEAEAEEDVNQFIISLAVAEQPSLLPAQKTVFSVLNIALRKHQANSPDSNMRSQDDW